jgi:hypothetical protein
MNPLHYPPDALMRAYTDLLYQVFLFLRSGGIETEELIHLTDALHNLSSMLTDYGVWIDDSEFRRLHLRPFDQRWRKQVFGLEKFLDERLAVYQQDDGHA